MCGKCVAWHCSSQAYRRHCIYKNWRIESKSTFLEQIDIFTIIIVNFAS